MLTRNLSAHDLAVGNISLKASCLASNTSKQAVALRLHAALLNPSRSSVRMRPMKELKTAMAAWRRRTAERTSLRATLRPTAKERRARTMSLEGWNKQGISLISYIM